MELLLNKEELVRDGRRAALAWKWVPSINCFIRMGGLIIATKIKQREFIIIFFPSTFIPSKSLSLVFDHQILLTDFPPPHFFLFIWPLDRPCYSRKKIWKNQLSHYPNVDLLLLRFRRIVSHLDPAHFLPSHPSSITRGPWSSPGPQPTNNIKRMSRLISIPISSFRRWFYFFGAAVSICPPFNYCRLLGRLGGKNKSFVSRPFIIGQARLEDILFLLI